MSTVNCEHYLPAAGQLAVAKRSQLTLTVPDPLVHPHLLNRKHTQLTTRFSSIYFFLARISVKVCFDYLQNCEYAAHYFTYIMHQEKK